MEQYICAIEKTHLNYLNQSYEKDYFYSFVYYGSTLP